MMKLSRTFAYAVCATLELAGAEPGKPVPCKKLARAGNIPERFLLQILRSLVTCGLLRSTRGVEGGYCLSRPSSEITLHDITEALHNPLEPSAAALQALKPGARERVLTALARADQLSRHELQSVTIADLWRASV
jgi:Rrf2 family protein